MLLVSRAPLAKLQSYKKRMGWNIGWVSTAGSDFIYDYAGGSGSGKFWGTSDRATGKIIEQ